MNRENAEAHWKYTKGVIERSCPGDLPTEEDFELMEYLYVQAMIHGYKHGLQTLEEKAI